MKTLAGEEASPRLIGTSGMHEPAVDNMGASLEAARLRDEACRETVAARFQRPANRLGACHRCVAALTRGSLSMTGRMLCALVIVMLVSPHVVNEPFDVTYGMRVPEYEWDVLGGGGWSFGPRASDLMRGIPALLAALFIGLAVLFATLATAGILLRESIGLGLHILYRWAQRHGVEVSDPRS